MKKLLRILAALITSCVALGFAACGGETNSNGQSTGQGSGESSGVEEIASPSIKNKPSGNTLSLTRETNTYQFQIDDYDGEVVWISTVKSVATISEDGLLTMLSAGVTEIILRDESTGGQDSIVLTVVDERVPETLSVTGIPAELRRGDESVQLTAVSSDYGEVAATFTSSDNSVATVSETGLLTPIAKGTVTITVTKADDPAITTVITVEVLGIDVEAIAFGQLPKYGLLVGDTYEFTTVGEPVDCEAYEIVWTVDKEEIAQFVDGKLLAKSVGQCKVTATVKGTDITAETTVTVSELTVEREDFRFAVAGTSNVQKVGPTITYSNADGEIVEYGEDNAFKLTTRGNGVENKLTVDFGTLSQGNYKLSFTYKVLAGRYSGAILMDDAEKVLTHVSATTYQGDDSYCFYFNQATEGGKKITFKTEQLAREGSILLDDIALVKVDAIPTESIIGTVTEQNFDEILSVNGQTSNIGGVYVSPDVHFAELVEDGNGGKALKVTRLENAQNKGTYGVVAFSLGRVAAGNYTLTMDIENDGYEAIMQAFQFAQTNGYVHMDCLQELNYRKLAQVAKKVGNTYTFTFSVAQDYENFGIALAGSAATTGESIIIDNVRFAPVGDQWTVDFDGMPSIIYKNSSVGLTKQVDEAWVNEPIEAIPYAGITGTLVDSYDSGFVSEDGNGYYKVNFKGWASWATFNLGYMKAGTYLISLDAKKLSGTWNGSFGYNISNKTITELTPCLQDGDRYTFKVALTEDCVDFNIGYKSVADMDADILVAFDNFTVRRMEDFAPDSVEISTQPTGTLFKGQTFDFAATVNPAWAEGYTLVWSVDGDTVGSIDAATGVFTANGVGKCNVTVTIAGTDISDTVEVTVEELFPESVKITTELSGSILKGSTVELKAEVFPEGCTNYVLVWSVDDDTVGTIDSATGKFTALKKGTCTVTVTVQGTDIKATLAVSVDEVVLPPDEGGVSEGTAPDNYGEWIDLVVKS